MNDSNTTVGVYIGRFQPLHNGHLETIKKALEEVDKLLIFVGSTNKPRSIKNPLSFNQRISLLSNSIKELFGEEITNAWSDYPRDSILNNVEFIPLRDYMYNDLKWASEVHSKALSKGATSDKQTKLYGCLKDDSSYYIKMFPQWDLNVEPYRWKLDATDVRKCFYKYALENKKIPSDLRISSTTHEFMKSWVTSDDAEHILDEYTYIENYHKQWGNTPHPVTFTTVDALVICSGCVLLIRRGIELGKGQWALAGGFLNQNERIEDGALRELKEETDIRVNINELRKCIKDTEIFDHPKRSLRGRIITHVHLIDLGYRTLPSINAGDDANEAHWVPIADALKMEEEFFEDHYDILTKMTSKY